MSLEVSCVYRAPVARICTQGDQVTGVCLENGEILEATTVLSTAGIPETIRLSDWAQDPEIYSGKMSFMETISVLPSSKSTALGRERTIILL